MITLTQGNRLEDLALVLQRQLLAAGRSPLEAQWIVVPNPGTGRWLVQRMAEQSGIAANLDMPLPASFFWRVLRAWLPDENSSPFDRDTLLWRILTVLPDNLEEESFADLRRYLQGDDRQLRQFQLAERIADVFDQYLVFRYQTVLAWEAGEEDHWQARLWRALTAEPVNHRAHLLQKLLKAMDAAPRQPDVLPAEIHLFGLNALPPVYLEILRRLGQYRRLYLYHLNPCREYWADLRSERSLAHHQQPQEAFLELGNPLLASFGHVGQVFLDQLLNLDSEQRELFTPAGSDTLLHQLQTDILDMLDGRRQPLPRPQENWPSLQFHGTHTRLREVQVLHDNLLRCFEELEGLKPGDILVMAPDMATYAPFVEAVFGTAENARQIPFSIGDRNLGGDNPLGDAVRWLLALPSCRFPASEVLALLEVNAVQHRFGLDEEALTRVRGWVRDSGIRWGLDERQREQLGLPGGEGLHSWRFGLKRLFLGYVTPVDDQRHLYPDGSVPWLDIEAPELAWAGALQALLDKLDEWRQRLDAARSLAAWQQDLSALLDNFFLPQDDQEAGLLLGLTQRLDELVELSGQGGFEADLSLEVIARLIDSGLQDRCAARGFLQGGVSFSDLLPMRALPYRVIALLGMNDSDFPRRQKRPSFDLMASGPQRSDRDRRRDDRYLFLETLISARDCLLISWQSRDARSDQERLPAEVVSELLDYLDRRFQRPQGQSRSDWWVQHRLQAFSADYFRAGDSRLFSYDDSWAPVAETRAGQAFISDALPDAAVPENIDLDTLIRFFNNPARLFLEARLALRLPNAEELPADSEPFELDTLQDWQIRDLVMQELLDHQPPALIGQCLRGEGWLPHGVPGELQKDAQLLRSLQLYHRLEPLLNEQPWQEPLELDCPLDSLRLTGRVQRYTGQGVLDFRVGKLRAQDRLCLWIQHLAVIAQNGQADQSLFVAEDKTGRLGRIDAEEARAYLNQLVEFYRQGMTQPLKFFPRTAWTFARYGKDWENEWFGNDYTGYAGESLDSAYQLVFRDQEVLDEEFMEVARKVYAPLIETLEEQ